MVSGSLSCSVPLLLDAVACMFRKRRENRRSFTPSSIRFSKQTYGKHTPSRATAGSTTFQSFGRSLVRRKAAPSIDQLWFMITTASDLKRGCCLGNVLNTHITSDRCVTVPVTGRRLTTTEPTPVPWVWYAQRMTRPTATARTGSPVGGEARSQPARAGAGKRAESGEQLSFVPSVSRDAPACVSPRTVCLPRAGFELVAFGSAADVTPAPFCIDSGTPVPGSPARLASSLEFADKVQRSFLPSHPSVPSRARKLAAVSSEFWRRGPSRHRLQSPRRSVATISSRPWRKRGSIYPRRAENRMDVDICASKVRYGMPGSPIGTHIDMTTLLYPDRTRHRVASYHQTRPPARLTRTIEAPQGNPQPRPFLPAIHPNPRNDTRYEASTSRRAPQIRITNPPPLVHTQLDRSQTASPRSHARCNCPGVNHSN